jgi:hypothetical protein
MKWTFKLHEPGHFDALDIILTPAIGYGVYRLARRYGESPWFWFAVGFVAWSILVAYVDLRKRGRCKWPWEART